MPGCCEEGAGLIPDEAIIYGFGQVGVSATPSTDRQEILIGRFRIASAR